MNADEVEFLKRLNATFRIEAEEHLRAISSGLIELEKETDKERKARRIEDAFREAHSLKGAARSVDQKDIELVCQPLEGVFSALKTGRIVLSPTLFDLLHTAVDAIERFVPVSDAGLSAPDRELAKDLIRRLGQAAAGEYSAQGEPPVSSKASSSEKGIESAGTVRLDAAKLDALLLQAEEMAQLKIIAGQRRAEIEEISRSLASWRAGSANRKDFDIEDHLSDAESRLSTISRAMEQDVRSIRKMVDEHLETMKKIVMLPVSSLVEAFPKMVRDLAREQGKEAEVLIQGAELELDKRILDELKDPLVHLLRNSVDHGIGTPDARAARGKPPRGKISLSFAAKNSRQMEITVSDDGAGLDAEKVKDAAVKAGYGPEENAERLIFQSGVSTSPIVTNISGRGLGLAIVREKVEKLNGEVSAGSESGIGTWFRLLVPLTLATFRGVLVRTNGRTFVFPTANVERVLRGNRELVRTVENRETVSVDGRVLSLVRLCDALELPIMKPQERSADGKITGSSDVLTMAILLLGEIRLAFQVDEVLDECQVIFKSLGPQLNRVRNISGATILGDGKVVPVLNVADLMKSAVRPGSASKPAGSQTEDAASARAVSILVADDSITARSLIQNILETAGYRVSTAVDGTDALTKAREEEFDAIVSDVDMPRMNGFDLTVSIRNEKRTAAIPVILVTALASQEDREHGIEVGANAYIVKSSFDQSDLLETVRRFV